MFLFRFRLFYLQLVRAKEIIFVLLHHGWREYLSKSRFGQRFISKKKMQALKIRTTQERIRITIEELGPTYIKFGQILADRPDVVSERLRRELKKLQSKARPMDDERAIELIEHELGQSIDELFSSFDREHMASASIGQAYQGVLHTGEKVVIKIQRPNIENKIQLDLYLMRYLSQKVVKNYPELAAIDVVGLVEEFGQTILKELNYISEASNILRFGEMFKNNPNIHIPKVYTEYCTRRLLMLEFIDGIPPDETIELVEKGYDLQKIAANGAEALLEMIFEHGYFHADPHPGNIFVMQNNVVGFIDFGMVGVLKPSHMNFLSSFILGFARNDAKTIAKSLLDLCGKKFYEYSDELEFEIQDLIKRNSYLPFDKVDFSQIIQECVNAVVKYKLRIPSSIYLLIKALATIQKFAEKLHPTISFSETILPYAKNMVKERYSPKNLAGALYNAVGDWVSLVRDAPAEINEILSRMKDGRLIHEISIHDSQPFVRIVRNISHRIAIALLLSAMVLCSTALVIWGDDPGFGRLVFGISFTLAFWLMLRNLFRTKSGE